MILECLEASEREEEEQKDHKENATKKDMPSSDITALNMSKDAFGDSSIGKSEDLDNEYTTSEAVAKQASQVVNSAILIHASNSSGTFVAMNFIDIVSTASK